LAKSAHNTLQKLKVNVITGTKVASHTQLSNGGFEVTLSNGEKKNVDLVLSTVGVKVNTSFLPKHLLNESDELIVDDTLTSTKAKDVWGAGDVIDKQKKQLVYTMKSAATLAANLDAVLRGKSPASFNAGPPVIAVTIGPGMWTSKGHMAGWSLPAPAIYMLKGKTLGTDKIQASVYGK
jgi:NADH dehydrogenase FAD-containing subunit